MTQAEPTAAAYLPAGTVYGTLLNFANEWQAWQPRMQAAPYKAAPQAPVLYIKPANTWSANGVSIPLPAGLAEVEVGATVALVFGSNTADASTKYSFDAIENVAYWVLMNDLSAPQPGFYRPPVRFNCPDGFLGVGTPRSAPCPTPGEVVVRINGVPVQTLDFSRLRRSPAQLVADVSDFTALQGGDVLMLGCDICGNGRRPLARAGDVVEISAPGFVSLVNRLVAAP